MLLVFFQNEEIFAQLDALDELDRVHPCMNGIQLQQLQPHRGTENILV